MIDDEAAVRTAYDSIADAYADRFTATEPELPLELAMLDHFAALLTGDRRVLDAGCGAGRMLPVLAGYGWDVEGVDLSPGMVRRAQRDHPGFRVGVASLTALPFDDRAFDGVVCWYSTIHFTDEPLRSALAEIRRVLRPGGLLLTGFQVGSGPVDLTETYRRHGHDVTLHRRDRRVEDVAAVLTSAGFAEVARMKRVAAVHEDSGQAVLIART